MRDVLISGAGIAGPTLAFWLRRYGFRPTVVERASRPRAGGYKIDIRGSAVEVARRMDILPEIRQESTDMRVARFVDSTGRTFVEMGSDTFGGRLDDDAEIMRGDLSDILYAATRDETEYLFGDSITGLEDDGAGVTVTFDRSPARRFDLVIGADGLRSAVRSLAFGPSENYLTGLGRRGRDVYIAIYTVPNWLGLDREELTYPTVGRIAQLYSTRKSDRAHALFMFDAEGVDLGRWSTPRRKQLLLDTFESVGWMVPRMLGEVPDADDFYLDSVSQVRMDRWSTGRVALLGDAGYCASPSSGQGTSLALVGAYVFAGELASARADYAGAFASYERQMRTFVEKNQRFGQRAAAYQVPRSRWGLAAMREFLRLQQRLPGKEWLAGRAVQHLADISSSVRLKDYPVIVR